MKEKRDEIVAGNANFVLPVIKEKLEYFVKRINLTMILITIVRICGIKILQMEQIHDRLAK